MADVTITPIKYSATNKMVGPYTTASDFALTASNQALIPTAGCKQITLYIECTTGGTLTVKAGNGIAGTKDLALTVVADKSYAIQLDTNAYQAVSGTDKGKIRIAPTTAVSKIVPVATL